MNRLAFAIFLVLAAGCSSVPRTLSGVPAPGLEALPASSRQVPDVGYLTAVASLTGPMPTGVTVSREGRLFISIPRWRDATTFTVAEIVNGQPVPFPNPEINTLPQGNPKTGLSDPSRLISAQSVVVDDDDRLWILDTGSINFQPTAPGGPKLVCVDLATRTVTRTIPIPREAALETSYLNDVRFDLRRGTRGMAYISDSTQTGPNAIIVVDLDTGAAWRRLSGHPSVTADRNYVPIIEGRPFVSRSSMFSRSQPVRIGVDGIALSPDGRTLYYTVFSGQRLYSIPTDLLVDPAISDADVARGVRFLGDKGFPSDGMACDAAGNLYMTDYANNAIKILTPQGRTVTLLQDPTLLFPDTLSLSGDGKLFILSNQLHRLPAYNQGIDRRSQPVAVLFETNAYAPRPYLSRDTLPYSPFDPRLATDRQVPTDMPDASSSLAEPSSDPSPN